MLARLLLYGYCMGVTSSRRIESATYDHVAFRYLAADQHPDHDTIATFRQENLEALAGLFFQQLRVCQKGGVVKMGNLAIDGAQILSKTSPPRPGGHKKMIESAQHAHGTAGRIPGPGHP